MSVDDTMPDAERDAAKAVAWDEGNLSGGYWGTTLTYPADVDPPADNPYRVGGGPMSEHGAEKDVPLTADEVAGLADGTPITVTWSGGNGPHDYVVAVDRFDRRYAAMNADPFDRMRFYNPLTSVGQEGFHTRVWTCVTSPAVHTLEQGVRALGGGPMSGHGTEKVQPTAEKDAGREYAIEADPGRLTASFPTFATYAGASAAATQPCMAREGLPFPRVLWRHAGSDWEVAR